MSTPYDYRIRLMQRAVLDLVVEWAAAEGWNPGRHDAAAFFATDPSGFWLGELGGEPVASISAVKYGAAFAFVGFYIVKPEHRGRGYGLQLWQAALASVAERVVGLDGVVAQQDKYRKSGFRLAYRNCRYEGTAAPLKTIPFENRPNVHDRVERMGAGVDRVGAPITMPMRCLVRHVFQGTGIFALDR